MQLAIETKGKLESEIILSATRSSGPGGQNVNKVNTKVELRFRIHESLILSAEEKELIRIKLANRINSADKLVISSESERSQIGNREQVLTKFFLLLESALKPRKRRIKTSATNSSKLKRLEAKKQKAQIKILRKPPGV